MPEPDHAAPKAFISYSWDDDTHKAWVKELATRLREDGVDVTLDRWHAAPGDQIPAFMERAVRENNFVIAVCTPKFKERSDERHGGVGYEGDIMTAYAFTGGNNRKFIPVLRRGSWREAAPTWLVGRAKIDLGGEPYSESEYEELLRTVHGAREEAPPIGRRPNFGDKKGSQVSPTPAPITPLAVSSTVQHQSPIMPMEQMPKLPIFISYSSRDRAEAEHLHAVLASRGHEVWRDKTRVETNWSRGIALALAESEVLCLIWTKHAAESKSVRHEWLGARALEKRVVPCIFPDAPALPEPLLNLEGVECPDAERGAAKLLSRLDQLVAEEHAVTYDYQILPPNSFLPFNPNPQFIGRQLDLIELYVRVLGNPNNVGANHVAVVGMGGIGKTQLVSEFGHRFSYAFEGVFWIQAADPATWIPQLVTLARDYLRLQITDARAADAHQQYLRALQAHSKAHPQILLILDNVPDPRMLHSERLPDAPIGFSLLSLGCRLLITTRRNTRVPGVVAQSLPSLTRESAYQLLTAERLPQGAAEIAAAEAICDAVGCLPLAVTLSARYLVKYPEVSYADYRSELAKDKLDAIDIGELSPEELATRHEAAVGVTISSQWAGLANQQARSLLRLCSAFPEASIVPVARLRLLSGLGPGLSKLDRPFDKALNDLMDLSLAEVLESVTAVRVHPVVRDFVARLSNPEELAGLQLGAAAHLKSALDDPSRLEAEYLSRGIDSVIEDLDVAIGWCARESSARTDLSLLHRVLDRERHHLQIKAQASAHVSPAFLQQLHLRKCNGIAGSVWQILACRSHPGPIPIRMHRDQLGREPRHHSHNEGPIVPR